MSVKVRLTRSGSKKHPFYRVVAINSDTRRDGRPLEFLGYYNPNTNPADVKLDQEKIDKWLATGAEMSFGIFFLYPGHVVTEHPCTPARRFRPADPPGPAPAGRAARRTGAQGCALLPPDSAAHFRRRNAFIKNSPVV